MDKKPTYEELAQRIKDLEREISRQNDSEGGPQINESELRSLVENSPDHLMIVDTSGIITYINFTVPGLVREETINTSIFKYVSPKYQKVIRECFERVLKSGRNDGYETEYTYPDGDVHIFNTRVAPIIKSSKIVAFSINTHDITEHKRAEEKLRISEKQYRAIVQDQTELICRFKPDFTLTFVNEAYARFWEKTPDQLIGKSFFVLIPEDEHETVKKHFMSFSPMKAIKSHEHKIKTKNGETGWQRWSNRAFFDGDGNIIEYQSVGRDITKRKQSEEALKKSQELYKALFEYNPVDTVVVNTEGKIVMWNLVEENANGGNPEIGATMYKDYAAKHQINMFEELMDSIKRGEPKEFLDLKYKKRFLCIRIAPFSEGAIITSIDSTPVKNLEAQLHQAHKLEVIGNLAGGIAHDFNNILGIIIGNTELAIDDVPDWNPAKGCLEEIRKASLRAKDLVRQLLSFTRKSTIKRTPIHILPIVQDTLKLLHATIPASIEIQEDIECKNDTIFADPTQMNQILMNLCSNASHAMRDSGGVLKISLKNEEFKVANEKLSLKPGKYVKLSVVDTGEGIDASIIDRIFDPYFTTKGLGVGTGLGLSVVQGIVTSHSGAVTVRSNPGEGTAFDVFLPLTDLDAVPVDRDTEATPEGNEKILFVDDEASLIRLGGKLLAKLGYHVETRRNPVDALDLIRSEPDRFDLVITDMTMPNMTGDKLSQEIQNIRSNIPIILCTGYSDKIDGEKAKLLGISAYVEKPFSTSKFPKTVRKVLDEAKGRT